MGVEWLKRYSILSSGLEKRCRFWKRGNDEQLVRIRFPVSGKRNFCLYPIHKFMLLSLHDMV